jgi:hypothetical protein
LLVSSFQSRIFGSGTSELATTEYEKLEVVLQEATVKLNLVEF